MVMHSADADLNATFGALADPTRRAILARLAKGDASVLDLAEPFDMSQPAISKHLKVLERAGLIARSRDAQRRPCRLEPRRLKQAADWLGTYRQFWEESYGRLDDYLHNCRPRRKPVTSRKLEIIAEPGKTSFTTKRIVDAPRALVFDAFTKCEHLKRWMGPRSLTMASCETDLRVGGRYRFVFRGPDGSEVGFSGEFREVVRAVANRPDVRVRADARRRGARDPRARGGRRQDHHQDDDAA